MSKKLSESIKATSAKAFSQIKYSNKNKQKEKLKELKNKFIDNINIYLKKIVKPENKIEDIHIMKKNILKEIEFFNISFNDKDLEKEIKNIEKLIRDLSKLKTFHSSDYEKKIFPKEDTDKINSMVLEHGFKLNLFDITKNESDDISENWDNVSAHSNHSEKSHYSIISNQELEKIKNKQSNEKRQTEQFDKTHKNLTPKIRYDTQNQDETFGMELSTLK